MSADADPRRARLARVLGWIAGGIAGFLANYLAWSAAVDRGVPWPAEPTTFVAFVAGAFGGMAAADRLGARAAPILATVLAVLLVVAVAVAASG